MVYEIDVGWMNTDIVNVGLSIATLYFGYKATLFTFLKFNPGLKT